MPTYEYECPKCGVFEFEQRISEAPLATCPQCENAGSTNPVKRIISASAFHLKGGGWYKSDYGAVKNEPKKEAPSETTSSGESASGGSDSGAKLESAPGTETPAKKEKREKPPVDKSN